MCSPDKTPDSGNQELTVGNSPRVDPDTLAGKPENLSCYAEVQLTDLTVLRRQVPKYVYRAFSPESGSNGRVEPNIPPSNSESGITPTGCQGGQGHEHFHDISPVSLGDMLRAHTRN